MKAEELPPDWKNVRLGEISSIVTGQSPPGDTYNAGGYGEPLINGPAEFGEIHPVPVQWTTASTKVCKQGDILFCVRGNTTGRMNSADQEYCIGRGIAAISGIQGNSDTSFIRYVLEQHQPTIYNIAVGGGSTFPNISGWQLADLAVAFPPLSEQRAIALALRTVQAAIETRRRELELERERKAALMQHLFTHGTRGEKTKQTDIGEMPEGWEVVRLERIFETQLGKMLSQKARTGQTSKPYLRNANVQWGAVNLADVFQMDFDEKETKKFRLRYGDILVCEGGEVGRTAIWRDELTECYFQKAVHRLRAKNHDMIAEFFLYWMEQSFLYSSIYGIAGTQTTIAHLPQEKLQAMNIPKPSLEDQQTIGRTLAACDTKATALEHEIERLEELFRAMLEELMTARLSAAALIE